MSVRFLITAYCVYAILSPIQSFSTSCKDSNRYASRCPTWAKYGECTSKYRSFMKKNCKKSCNECIGYLSTNCDDAKKYTASCPIWAHYGHCTKSSGFMKHYCKKSCHECPNTSSTPKWEVFQTTWPLFDSNPRTVEEAIAMGWSKVSDDCSYGAEFPGQRYAPPKREKPPPQQLLTYAPEGSLPEIIIIYDKNGYIAGVHHIVTSPKRYDWVDGRQWFQTGSVQGKDVEMTTVYFVDPKLICGAGRTEKDFEKQGTGNLLWIRNGPKYNDVFKVPLRREEVEKQLFEHYCVITAGTHWLNAPGFNTSGSCNTNRGIPFVILTDQDDDVNGYGLQMFGEDYRGYRYEVANEGIVGLSLKQPGCFLEYGKNGTIFSMHVYLKGDPGKFPDEPKITCPEPGIQG